jgi:hypothetical protein
MYLWLMVWHKEDHFKPTMQICYGPILQIHKEAESKWNHAEVNFKNQEK